MRKRKFCSDKEVEIPLTKCPFCGYPHKHSEHINEQARPSPGDVSICYCCLSPGIFDEQMQVRKPTFEESMDIKKSQGVERAIAQIIWEKSHA